MQEDTTGAKEEQHSQLAHRHGPLLSPTATTPPSPRHSLAQCTTPHPAQPCSRSGTAAPATLPTVASVSFRLAQLLCQASSLAAALPTLALAHDYHPPCACRGRGSSCTDCAAAAVSSSSRVQMVSRRRSCHCHCHCCLHQHILHSAAGPAWIQRAQWVFNWCIDVPSMRVVRVCVSVGCLCRVTMCWSWRWRRCSVLL